MCGCLLAVVLAACNSEVTSSGPGASSSSTSAGGQGGQGQGGQGLGGSAGGGMPDPDQGDHQALDACGSASCPTGFAQRIEGGTPFALHDMGCIVTALRDRTPGLYRVELDHTWSNGSSTSTHTLLITPSGEVETGELVESSIYVGPGNEQTIDYQPTERCALKPVSFFEDCLAEVQMGEDMQATDAAWACIYPESGPEPPWFDGCTAQAPTCQ
jgi:hypothetical protein